RGHRALRGGQGLHLARDPGGHSRRRRAAHRLARNADRPRRQPRAAELAAVRSGQPVIGISERRVVVNSLDRSAPGANNGAIKGASMKIDIGINETDRAKIAQALSRLLADTYTLYLKTHN